ncbi:hypothetical protein PSHT_09490 [Puccinia striiformis]|uniref:HTH CENPB-type domain-containing protein n=1 Tax=Puccinia striiformis TaxID=27350 RepID=A0A2S4VG96_9BASI|nr:hypothetical protein PSHT_09490 [Puccinia striiformis]
MAFQDATQSFVELLRQLRESSLHISCVANTLYAHEGSTQPSLNDATKACEELKLDILENHFGLMKVKYKGRQSQLTAKMNRGESLTADEEEWLDGEGNLVSGELLISRLSTISSASGDQSICLSSDDKAIPTDNGSSMKKSTNPIKESSLEKSAISNASYAEKVQVLDWHHKNGKNQTKTCKYFKNIFPQLKIEQPLLSKWLKAEDSIREKHQQSSHNATNGSETLAYPKVEAALSEWMTQAIHYGIPVSGEILKENWRDFAWLDGIPSEEWLNEIIRMQEITKDYKLKDIFNMDKTGLFYSMPPDVGLAFKATHGVKSNKTRRTLALTCNADGSEKRPPLFIGKSKKPNVSKDTRLIIITTNTPTTLPLG